MNTKISRLLLLIAATATLAACSDDANEWPVDPSHARLFRSTHMELVETLPTSVEISYNGVTDATKYVFEFSLGDSLLFDNIVLTEEAHADTLVAYSPGKSVTQNEYRKLFTNLNGTTRYSVRMKAVNENTGEESDYNQLSFVTPAEQIFTGCTPGIKDAILNWEADKAATTIRLGQLNRPDTAWIQTLTLTSAMQQAGEATFTGLEPGHRYVAQIFNGQFLRGTYTFSTLGSAVGQAIEVSTGDDVNALLAAATAETVTLIFTGDQTYEVGNLKIPENVKNLYVSGSIVNGKRATLHIPSCSLSAPMDDLVFQYVEIDDEQKNGFWLMVSNANCFKNATFDGCYIHNIPNCLIYVSAKDASVNDVTINNCIIERVSTSGWGVINFGSAAALHSLSITNSTLKELSDQLMDMRVSADVITIDNCTFCNYEMGMSKLLLVTKAPKEMYMTDMIFTGTNNGQKMNSGWGNYQAWLDFSGCYMTSDFPEGNTQFFNITHLSQPSDELFVDPKNGDFHFKDGVVFAGKGKAGDPRWWK